MEEVKKKDEAKGPKKDAEPALKVVKPEAAPAEPEAAAQPTPAQDRSVVLLVNGANVRIGPSQLAPLEICEACRRVLRALGG